MAAYGGDGNVGKNANQTYDAVSVLGAALTANKCATNGDSLAGALRALPPQSVSVWEPDRQAVLRQQSQWLLSIGPGRLQVRRRQTRGGEVARRMGGGAASRIAVVTGGGTGIGRAVATAFVRGGDQVVIVGRRAEVLERAATDLGPGSGTRWRTADVGSVDDVQALADWLQQTFGTVDVLVNCAGGTVSIPPDATLARAHDVWRSVTAVNLTGAFLMAQALSPLLPGHDRSHRLHQLDRRVHRRHNLAWRRTRQPRQACTG